MGKPGNDDVKIWNHGPDLIDDDGEVRELTDEDFARMVPFSELPKEQQEWLLSVKNATTRLVEERMEVPVAKSVVEGFRATGSGWEERVDEALREWLARRKAS